RSRPLPVQASTLRWMSWLPSGTDGNSGPSTDPRENAKVDKSTIGVSFCLATRLLQVSAA
ncbi:MAG TPA: hypothetical protein VHK01_10340, partial [Lacipirellulaceae bacterium]|nr:hypothetical protein [Lacipirellulaceae bacterium]